MTQTTLFSYELDEFDEPTVYAGDSVWGCDWGSGYFHVWRDGIYKRLKPEDFASLDFAATGDVVVVENAHMQPQTIKSLAQVFTIEQLFQIKDVATTKSIDIRLWFHSQTPKWRDMLNMGEKTDEIDAQTIARIIAKRGIVDLQYFNPRVCYPPRIRWAHEQLDDMNTILNAARIDYKAAICPAVKEFFTVANRQTQFKVWNLYGEHSAITTDINKWFYGFESRSGISLWAALVDWNGSPREYNGQQPGVKFIMNELLKMKPNHFRGGVARSNLMHHGFRNLAIKHLGTRNTGKANKIKKLCEFTDAEQSKWLNLRQRYRKAMVCTLHAMKAYLNK